MFTDDLTHEPRLLVPKKRDREATLHALTRASEILEGVTPFAGTAIKPALEGLASELGWSKSEINGATVRVAVTGRTIGPPLYESLEILGKERALERIEKARVPLAGNHD